MINLHYNFKLKEKLEYEDAIKLAETFLDEILNKVSNEMREITSYISMAKGKGIRSKLLLLSSLGDDGLVSLDAVKAASSVEILHLATLVHDDIIDDADKRRGLESVQRRFGKKEAVIAGDYLFCLSFSLISDLDTKYADEKNIKFVSEFAGLVSNICMGELSQFRNNKNIDLTITQYLRIISGKTASLFSISSYAGAILGQCDEPEIKLLSRFGRYFGMIFQIIDDCKDYESSEEKTLKPVKKDIEQGVVTLPLILSMTKYNELKTLAKDVFLSHKKYETLFNEVYESGGITDAIIIASKYYEKSKALLLKLDNEIKSKMLLEVLNDIGGAYFSSLKNRQFSI